jgi:DNA-binding transcriptional regulator YhcF (GntR family)
VSLYEQVAKMLRDEIAQGTMTGRIPSVHTIAGHHQVSPRVAARALEILQGEGMIENVPRAQPPATAGAVSAFP